MCVAAGGVGAGGMRPPLLPNDLVPGREADEVGNPLDHDHVAIVHEGGYRRLHGHHLAHAMPLKQSSMMARAVSTSDSSTTSGGASRSVLLPAPSSSRPLRNARCTSSCGISGAGARVARSLTNSTPVMSPRPRTSPIVR